MIVYVKNADGKKLMPCSPAKARKLLQAHQAMIVNYRPFTIQLSWQCEGHTQEVTLGVDKGSRVSGMLCIGNALTLFAAEVVHRQDVKAKMADRRDRRKSRRNRISFRPKQTRKQFLSCPQKGKGRVHYQVNDELESFRKGDLVLVKGNFIKRINSIYSSGYLAFPRIKGEPNTTRPKHCQLLERAKTILWEVKSAQDAQEKSCIRYES